jgi:hypothetical protein
MFQSYANLGGNSSVSAFDIGTASLDVQFSDGKAYRYSNRSCGAGHCEQMKSLALAGRGLNSYIMRNVRFDYER